MKYSDIILANKKLENELSGNEYSVAVISNIVVNQLKEIFEYTIRSEGINTNCTFGNYDNILQDAERFQDRNLVVVFWELANLIDGLQYKADLFDKKKIDEFINKTKAELDLVMKILSNTSYVLINKFSSLLFNYNLINPNNFDYIADELNAYLLEIKPKNVSLIETDKIIAKTSIDQSVDLRFFYSSKALYTIEFFKNWSNYVLPIVKSLNGKTKKALILDCDNTLWRGILGEDGHDNILLSSNQIGGAPYEEVQSIAKALIKEGIILGICSKNNLNDVEEVLNNHQWVTLKSEDFSIKRINWDDKVSNLINISKTLNIGLDSLVFIDDSDFEINFVKESLPEVTALQVPEKPFNYGQEVRNNLSLFYNVSKTDEDLERIKMYKEQVQREEAKSVYDNLEEFIKSLEISIEVHIDDSRIVPRMSQMTQKTNQFNLTTKRYTEADIQSFINDEHFSVIGISLSDKFGESGVTGLAIIKTDGDTAEIDTFLMSCRIIGRRVEYRFFDYLVDRLVNRGIKRIFAEFRETKKNGQVQRFYDTVGFDVLEKTKESTKYVIETENYKPKQTININLKNGE